MEMNQQLDISRKMFNGVLNKEFERMGIKTMLKDADSNSMKISEVKRMTLQEMIEMKTEFESKT